MFKKLFSCSNIRIRIPFPIVDVYYFNWSPNVRTRIHDHAEKGCLMILINGKLNEKLYNQQLDVIAVSDYKSPNISFINDKKGYHSVKALEPTKSIHIYYPKGHVTKNYG